MRASIKTLTTGIVGFLLGVASTSFVHGQGETVSGTAIRVGFAVRDIDKSAQKFTELFGVTIPPVRTFRYTYRGKKENLKYTSFTAFGTQIELLQNFDGAGPYSDFIAKHGEGMHHFDLQVADVPRARDFLLAKGAIRDPVTADIEELVDLAPMLPFSFDITKAPAAR